MRHLLHLLSLWRIVSAASDYLEIPASGQWDGNDGPWSSFDFFIGRPAQRMRLLPSTFSPLLMPLSKQFCVTTGSVSCNSSDNSLYSSDPQGSWKDLGIGGLPSLRSSIIRNTTYFDGQSQLGLDSLFTQQDTIILSSTLVGAIYNVIGYSTGMFRVLGLPMTLATGANYSSLLSDLKSKGVIKSHSWSYTAGVVSEQQLGSFIFGGYDQSRFDHANSIVATRNETATDDTRTSNFNVTLLNIRDDADPRGNLLSAEQSIITRINTDTAQIWLPFQTCRQFEDLCNITRNAHHNLYLLDAADVANLKQKNSTLMFRVAANRTTGDFVTIDIPLSFLILSITVNSTKYSYFPVRCTNNPNEFTLGRAFFQAAYLTVNFDDRTLKLSKARYPESKIAPDIISIPPPERSNPSKTRATIIGGILGPLAIILALALCYFLYRRRRTSKPAPPTSESPFHETIKPELAASPLDAPPAYRRRHSSNVTTRSEIDGINTTLPSHLDTLSEVNEATEKPVHEALSPVELEAEPVQISELFGGYEGVEMRARGGGSREGLSPSGSYHDELADHIEEPISPVHEAEVEVGAQAGVMQNQSGNHRLLRPDF